MYTSPTDDLIPSCVFPPLTVHHKLTYICMDLLPTDFPDSYLVLAEYPLPEP